MDPTLKQYLLDLAKWRRDALAWADAEQARAMGATVEDESGNNGPPPPPPSFTASAIEG